jgi:hypothetical protein
MHCAGIMNFAMKLHELRKIATDVDRRLSARKVSLIFFENEPKTKLWGQ